MIKTVKHDELNICIATACLNTQILNIIGWNNNLIEFKCL